jgi:hypothetical protein
MFLIFQINSCPLCRFKLPKESTSVLQFYSSGQQPGESQGESHGQSQGQGHVWRGQNAAYALSSANNYQQGFPFFR